MSSGVRCTVTEKREPVTWGQMGTPTLDLEITWSSGDEDSVVATVTEAFESAIDKINAARPAAASTPQEGTTTS